MPLPAPETRALDRPTTGWADPTALRALHAQAGAAVGIVERDVVLAGAPVLLRFAGQALLDRVWPALAHLSHERRPPMLVVNLWDSASTRVEPPAFPNVSPAFDGERARYYAELGGVRASYQPGNGMLSVLDATRREAWYWAEDADRLPFLDAAEPIRQILHWWLGDRGVQLLHGGAVGTPNGGVLLTGRNGSGKSTATLASLGRLAYAGDDYVAVEDGDPPRVHSLYCTGKLEHHHLERFRGLLPGLPPAGDVDDKTVLFVHDLYPETVIAEFPLRAIVVPRVTERTTARLLPTPAAAALAALAPTTLLQHHPPQPEALRAMRDLVESVPTLSLELGSDLASIPSALLEFLEGAG